MSISDYREFEIVVRVKAEDTYVSEMREYVEDAVSSWGGQFHPEDPLFSANIDVKVKSCRLVKDGS